MTVFLVSVNMGTAIAMESKVLCLTFCLTFEVPLCK